VCELLASKRLVEIVGRGASARTSRRDCNRTPPDDAGCGAAGGVWLARLETAATAHEVIDTLIAALNVTGGEAALIERLKGDGALVILDNCEHVIDAAADLVGRLLDAAPGVADPVHQPGSTRRRR
jgi:predicted ATPase